MRLDEYSMEEFYQEQIAYLQGENKKLEKNLALYHTQMKKAKQKIAVDVLLFLLFCAIFNILESGDIYMEALFMKYIIASLVLAFAMVLKFFWDLFHLFGEYGLPTFAKLFLGGQEFSCKTLIEETEAEFAKNACKMEGLKEKMEAENID